MSRPRRRRPNAPRAATPAAAAPQPSRGSGASNARRGPRPQQQAHTRVHGLDPAAAETLVAPPVRVRPTDAPDALVRSLGVPPLPGHELPAEHYFAAVYERSVALATALASAAGLLDDTDPDPDPE